MVLDAAGLASQSRTRVRTAEDRTREAGDHDAVALSSQRRTGAKRMAGTTRLKLATSAVTVSGLQVLSTTWKSTDGTVSHWKYVVDNVIVYRHAYRGLSFNLEALKPFPPSIVRPAIQFFCSE
jgi:hypothetical protein